SWSSISVSYRSRSSALTVSPASVAGSGPPLPDLRRLPDPVAQVVELRPAHVPPTHDLDAGDDRRVHREGPLDAHTEADLAHGDRLAGAAALAPDHRPLEDLHPFAVPLDDANVHLEGVAGREVRNVRT